jgi:hypothetical protein
MKKSTSPRGEKRSYCEDLEIVHFHTKEDPSLSFSMIIIDRSTSGMCCLCVDNSGLKVGAHLNNAKEELYEIKWLEQLSDSVINLGLKKSDG